MRGDGLGVAQVVGNLDDFQRVHEPERGLLAARHLERHQRAARPHLRHRKPVLRDAGRPGKITRATRVRLPAPSAIGSAESAIARQRRSSVAMPFRCIQAVNGLIAPPVCFM